MFAIKIFLLHFTFGVFFFCVFAAKTSEGGENFIGKYSDVIWVGLKGASGCLEDVEDAVEFISLKTNFATLGGKSFNGFLKFKFRFKTGGVKICKWRTIDSSQKRTKEKFIRVLTPETRSFKHRTSIHRLRMSLDATLAASQGIECQLKPKRPPPVHVTGDLTPTSSSEELTQADPPAEVPAVVPTLNELLTAPTMPEEQPGLGWGFYNYAMETTMPILNRAPKRKVEGYLGYNRSMFAVVKERPSALKHCVEELPELTPAPEANVKAFFPCNYCDKPYKTTKTLGKHQRECEDNPNRAIFECQVCFKIIKPSGKTVHMKTHKK